MQRGCAGRSSEEHLNDNAGDLQRQEARVLNIGAGHAEMRTSFVGHHIGATFELRAGVVKAEARRVERSERLDGAEHSSILIIVMADFWQERSLKTTARFAKDLQRVRE